MCVLAYTNNLLDSDGCLEQTFVSTGFSNWKDAVLKTTTLPKTTHVGEMLFSQPVRQHEEQWKMFLKLLSKAWFLCRQGLLFHGDIESHSRFIRLIHLCSEDSADLITWMKQKTHKYTSYNMQNEMVKAMGLYVL